MDELEALRGAVEGHDALFAALEGRVTALLAQEAAAAALSQRLGGLDEQVRALEGTIGERDGALEAASAAAAERDGRLAALADRYRNAVVGGLPEAARALVTATEPEAVDAQAAAIRQTVEALRGELGQAAALAAAAAVPQGAGNGRAPLDLSSLSPREKIAYGLAERAS